MTIRTRTIITLALAFLALLTASVVLLYLVVTPKFEELERQEVHNSVDRVVKEVEDAANHLNSTASDWAEWDETYRFLAGQNPSYIRENLDLGSILNLSVDFMLYLDTRGEVVLQRTVDHKRGASEANSEEVALAVVKSGVWSGESRAKGVRGLLKAGNRQVIIAARPILKSDKSGPPLGTLVFGRFMDGVFTAEASDKLNSDISFTPMDSPRMTERLARVHSSVFHGVTIFTDQPGTDRITGFTLLNDISGKPFLAAEVKSNRLIARSGATAILHATFALITVGVLFTLLVIMLIDRTVLGRLSRMTLAIKEGRRKTGGHVDFNEHAPDEIGILAGTIEHALMEESRRAEELAASEKRKEMALAGGDLGFWEYDLKSGKAYFSERFVSMLGYAEGELTPGLETLLDLIHEKERAAASEKLKEALASASPQWDMTYRVRCRDLSYRNIHSRGRVVRTGQGGEPWLVSGTHMDITESVKAKEQKDRLEEQVRNSQRMKAIGTLAGGVAHNFNNILAAIIGYTELVMEDLDPDTLAHDNAGEVINASNRASELVRQLLIFSQERDRVTETVDIRKIVEETFRFMREVIPTSIEMAYTLPDTPIFVTCDTYLMRQAFINICTNAREAMPENRGRIILSVTASAAGEGEEAARGTVVLTFTDDGAGMDQATLERAFDPYFTTKGDAERAGLGLSLVHGTITECGGSVSLKSRSGIGTTLSLTLPAVVGKTWSVPEKKGALGGHERILFVDDENHLAAIARQYFTKLGYDIAVYTRPVEALEKFLSGPYAWDLVITDMTMPDYNGVELASHIHQIRPELPIFLCSGYIDVVSDEERKSSGIREVFRKPASLDQMAGVVRKLFDAAGQ